MDSSLGLAKQPGTSKAAQDKAVLDQQTAQLQFAEKNVKVLTNADLEEYTYQGQPSPDKQRFVSYVSTHKASYLKQLTLTTDRGAKLCVRLL